MKEGWYQKVGVLIGMYTGICVWTYAIKMWGLVFGITLGWIPAYFACIWTITLWPIVTIGYILYVIVNI